MRIFICILLSLPLIGVSQFKNVRIIQDTAFKRTVAEPSIAISRTNPAIQVAGSIIDRVHMSSDSGHTWNSFSLSSEYGVWGDPVILSDTAGSFYYFHLSDPEGTNWASEKILDRIVVQRSDDEGLSWTSGSYMGEDHPKDQDKHWVCIDPKTNIIHATWTQFDLYGSKDRKNRSNILYSSSSDKGESWTKPLQVNTTSGNCLDGDSTTEGAVPAYHPDGFVCATWAVGESLFFSKSSDGIVWSAENEIAKIEGGWEIDIKGLGRANGMPITLIDQSESENRGTIYVNWVDDRRGNYDVWFIKSTDKGESWSKPIRINKDKKKADQFFTWMVCDPISGYLYAVYYDRRDTRGTDTDVYLARSADGGDSWNEFKISENSFKPEPLLFFGDYNNIDARNGVIRPIWTANDGNGIMSIWTAIISEEDLKDGK